jgi:hypothetical protein
VAEQVARGQHDRFCLDHGGAEVTGIGEAVGNCREAIDADGFEPVESALLDERPGPLAVFAGQLAVLGEDGVLVGQGLAGEVLAEREARARLDEIEEPNTATGAANRKTG